MVLVASYTSIQAMLYNRVNRIDDNNNNNNI